jgi:tRNA (cmo5U34)-methyltransferase
MLERSIPGYEDMRRAVREVVVAFAQHDGTVLDVGCSDGLALADTLHNRPDLHGVGLEISEPMLDAARNRLSRFGDRAEVRHHDLRQALPDDLTNLAAVTSILTLQFTPIEHRQRIVTRLAERLTLGAPLILVEKVLGSSDRVDDTLVAVYYDRKRAAGYTDDEIERKRLSLEGVLVPITAAWNEDLLRSAGFTVVECIWRSLNFAGWVALKGSG